MPIGAIFGAGFSQLFIKCFNRKHSNYIMLIVLWVGLGIMMIHNWVTIIVGRLIEGVAIGLYVSVGPIFLKEVTPK
jgi:MFS family permease